MNAESSNPVLKTLLQCAEALSFCWAQYLKKLRESSWSRVLLACLLAWIVGAVLFLLPLATLLIWASLLIKLFYPGSVAKEDAGNSSAQLQHEDTQ